MAPVSGPKYPPPPNPKVRPPCKFSTSRKFSGLFPMRLRAPCLVELRSIISQFDDNAHGTHVFHIKAQRRDLRRRRTATFFRSVFSGCSEVTFPVTFHQAPPTPVASVMMPYSLEMASPLIISPFRNRLDSFWNRFWKKAPFCPSYGHFKLTACHLPVEFCLQKYEKICGHCKFAYPLRRPKGGR